MGNEATDEVGRLLLLADHPSTPAVIRRKLPALRAQASTGALRAWEQFLELAESALLQLPRSSPQVTLYRAQSLSVWLRHCTTAEFRDLDPELVRRLLERSDDPDAMLATMLERHGTVFPWNHSWLVAADERIRQATAARLVTLLQLGFQRPPFVLCVLPLERLLSAGVEVRTPTAADAAIGRHYQWEESGLPAGAEYVDMNVPGSAVEEVLWRA